ncbi:MAG: leucine-rich repeat protein, partial [Ruminococcus sp.]|nr:leucine-rich repeat protein [Ruminococcus sp.]
MGKTRNRVIRLSSIVIGLVIILAAAIFTCSVSTTTFGSGGRAHRQSTTAQWNGEWILKESANYNSSTGVYQLTPNTGDKRGSIVTKEELGKDFCVELDYYSGNHDGADGMGFAFYGDYRLSTGSEAPSGLKYYVNIDTYHNGYEPLSSNYISLRNSTRDNLDSYLTYAALSESEDSQYHHLKIDVQNGTCSVYVDNNLKFSYDGLVYDDNNTLWIGARTGGSCNEHAVKNINIYSYLSDDPAEIYNANGFTYTISNGNATIIGYSGSETYLTIPATLSGCPVTAIGEGVFADCSDLKAVVLKNSSITIADDAFANDENLTMIGYSSSTAHTWQTTHGSNVRFMAIDSDNIFTYSLSGTEATITGLKSGVDIPANLVVPPYYYTNGTLYTVTTIYNGQWGTGAFANSTITSAMLPDTLKTLGNYAFYNCAKLKSVYFPNSVTSIGNWVFENCVSLEGVKISAYVTSIGDGAFACCPKITQFEVASGNSKYSSPDGNLYDKNKTYLYQYALGSPAASYEVPSTVTQIFNYAFRRSHNLETITVASGNSSFSAEDGVLYNSNKSTLIAYPAGKKGTTFTVPNSVSTIQSFSLQYNKLETIIIPSNVSTLQEWLFTGSTNLTDVVFLRSDSMTIGTNSFGDTNANLTFYGYSGSSAQNYANGKSPKIPFVEITAYENGWLYNSADDGKIVGYVGDKKDITIPATVDGSAVTSVAANVFKDNEDITSVAFPSNITSIGAGAFDGCSNLKYATILNENATIASTAFDNHANDLTIYGYAGSTAETFANSKNIRFVAITESMGDREKTITVTATYDDAVNTDECKQTVEYYADTTQAATDRQQLVSGGSVTFDCGNYNITPTLNLKSNSKVSITSITVRDANNPDNETNDITSTAFGAAQYKTDFLESCKTSLFGFVEFQNITGNITVEVTYGEPITSIGSGNYYSTTVITKGDVGPYHKTYKNDYNYQDLSVKNSYNNSCYTTYTAGASSPSVKGSGNYFNKSGGYHMRDGGQITRYNLNHDQWKHYTTTTSFDLSYYSYISDIKMYYNDNGTEVKDLSSLAGKDISIDKTDSYTAYDAVRSVTYVVTYKAIPKTTIYTKMTWKQNRPSTSNYKVNMETDAGAKFAMYYNGGLTSNNVCTSFDEDYNVFTYDINYARDCKWSVIDSDSVKYYFSSNTYNTGEFKNVKVYALDVENNTYGEQLAGDGCTNPQLTITYSPARTHYDDSGWVEISGLKDYDGDIYVTAEPCIYKYKFMFEQTGYHQNSFTITADALGSISDPEAWDSCTANLNSSLTISPDTAPEYRMFYGGGTYTIRSADTITSVSLKYTKIGGSYFNSNDISTHNADGSVTFTLPSDFNSFSQSAGSGSYYLTVNFESVESNEAQVYPTASGAAINNYQAYWNTTSPNNNNLVKIFTYDKSGEPSVGMFSQGGHRYSSYNIMGYKSDNFNCVSSKQIPKGTIVKVKNVWQTERRAEAANRPQKLIDFVNQRMIFKGIKVYTKNGSTIGDEIPCTTEGDYYVFTMPESGVRIVPEYDHHIRSVTILSNQRQSISNNNTYPIGASLSLGTATLTGDENNWFLYRGWDNMHDSYVSTSVSQSDTYYNAGYEWMNQRTITLDGSSFTMTAAPKNNEQYEIKSVRAYKHNNSTNYYNNVYSGGLSNTSTYNFLTYDDDGNITNTEITNDIVASKSEHVVEFISADETTGTNTYHINLPETLDAGNIVLRVEVVPVTKFARFQYVKDSASGAFNPRVTLNGMFKNSDLSSIDATDGETVEAAVYDNDASHILNVEIGGDSTKNSVLYNRSMVYEIRDYSDDT